LSRILAALPEDVQGEVIEKVEEIDAEEMERSSSKEAKAEATKVEKQVEGRKGASAQNKGGKDKKGSDCVIA
jgi:hypothetical protein